jgi:DNA-binding NtrC family response regulator
MNKIILCIDDETMILTSLKSQLKRHFGNQFKYEFAENACEGLTLIDELINDENIIIIIVSDWLMPGIKGDEFLIKVHQKYPKIIKIMLTGMANDEAVENARKNADLYQYINKPWTENELIDVIKSGLEKLSLI